MSAETPAPEEPTKTLLEELQSWWEIVSIAQYISLFRESFNLPEIEIEELENGLIEDSTNGPSSWLQDLLFSLLRTLMPGRINKENWEVHLQKFVTRKWPVGQETPFPADTSFSDLGLRTKVEIIYLLCERRLDRTDISEVMKSMDSDALRVQKLGVDDLGHTYWYFYGTRLYKEESIKEEKSWSEEWNNQKKDTFKKRGRGRPRKIRAPVKSDGETDDFEDDKYMNVNAKSLWSVVCDTLEQWIAFAAKFQSSKSKNEKSLFQIVQENFLPTLSKIYEEKERKIQLRLKELMPLREKIVTRRETRKLRGDTFESPNAKGYSSSDEPHKQHLIKDRARRLEERNRRTFEDAASDIRRLKRQRHSNEYEGCSSEPDHSQGGDDEYNYALTPQNDGPKMDLQSQMERLISCVKLNTDAWPFIHPVKEEDAMGYYEIIKDPVDLSTIESRLRNGDYETVGELDADFSQMVANCKLYNGEYHGFSKMAHTLWKMFRRGVSKILDSIPSEENDVSEENSNSSDHILKSPRIRKAKKHKREKRTKKKSAGGLEALEMLAQASELAIQNSSCNDMINDSDMHEQKKLNDFSNLNISTTNNHPQSLIDKFSSESSNEGVAENVASYVRPPSYINSQHARSSPNEATIAAASKKSVSYINNNLVQLANFIEKNNIKSLNILSNNDVTNVLSDSSSSHHENENSNSPIAVPSTSFLREPESTENLDQGLGNILEDCNENVSNIITQIIKQPMYSSENQLPHSSSDNNSLSYMENLPNEDVNLSKSIRKTSPIPNYACSTASETMPFIQNGNAQPELRSSPSNLLTVDASALGISSYSPIPTKTTNSQSPPVAISHGHTRNNQNTEGLLRKPSPTFQQQLQLSPNGLFSNQFFGSDTVSYPPSTNAPVSYQPLNFNHPDAVSSGQNTYAHSATSSTETMPLQVPVTYPQSIQQQQVQPLQVPASYPQSIQQQQVQTRVHIENEGRSMRVSVPPPGGHIMVVSEAATTGSGVTYHVYAQSKMDQSITEDHINYVPGRGATRIRMSPKAGISVANNQDNNVNSTFSPQKTSRIPQQFQAAPPKRKSISPQFQTLPPQKPSIPQQFQTAPSQKTSIPQLFQTVPHNVPSQKKPCYFPTNTVSTSVLKTSLPITSSNFVPVQPQGNIRNRPLIIRTKLPDNIQPVNTTSFNRIPSANETFNSVAQNNSNLYQTTVSRTVPVVFSGYNNQPPSSNQSQVPATMQPNLCLPNGGMVQRVLIPSGQQQIQVQNGGQFILTSPQGALNRVYTNNQSPQMQSNMRQLNQSFEKVMPQMISQAPMVQMTKDGLQGLQLQAVAQNGAQAFTQVSPNSQFVNIPTYMITNQNQVQAVTPTVMTMQQFQMAQRGQMQQMNGQGNG